MRKKSELPEAPRPRDGAARLSRGRLVALILILLSALIGGAARMAWRTDDGGDAVDRPLADSAEARAVKNVKTDDEPGSVASDAVRSAWTADSEELSGLTELFGNALRAGDDAPLENADVVVYRSGENGLEVVGRAKTDAAGAFRLTRVPRRKLLLCARLEPFAPAFTELDRPLLECMPARVGPLQLRLARGWTVSGEVRFGDGRAAAGVEVRHEEWVRSDSGGARWLDGAFPDVPAAKSAADGTFRLAGIPEPSQGLIQIIARTEMESGFADVRTESASRDESGAAAVAGVTVVVGPSRIIEGEIVSSDGPPIAGAAAAVGRVLVATDAVGRFRAVLDARDSAATTTIVASAAGFAWRAVAIGAADVPSSKLRIVLGRGVSLGGVAQLSDGEAADGALVTAEGRTFLGGLGPSFPPHWTPALPRLHALETRRVRAGADGRFMLRAVPREALLVFGSFGAGAPPGTPQTVEPPADGVRVVVPRAADGVATVDGRVVDGATRQPLRRFLLTMSGGGRKVVVPHGSDGLFAIEACPAGSVRLRVAPEPGDDFEPVERELTVRAGSAWHDVQLEVGAGGSVSLFIADGAPAAARDLRIELQPVDHDPDAAGVAASIDAGGAFEYKQVRAGRYRVAVVDGALALPRPVEITVHAGESQRVGLSLVPASPLQIVVRPRGEEETLAPYRIRIADEAGFVVLDVREGSGRELAGSGARVVLPAGNYSVSVLRQDQTLQKKPVSVAAGADALLMFSIDADPR